MIKKEEFKDIISKYIDREDMLNNFDDLGLHIWSVPVVTFGDLMFEKLIKVLFNSDGSEWIFWWLYEKKDRDDIKAYDDEHNEIPTKTIDDLWNLVKEYRI